MNHLGNSAHNGLFNEEHTLNPFASVTDIVDIFLLPRTYGFTVLNRALPSQEVQSSSCALFPHQQMFLRTYNFGIGDILV